MVLRKSFYIRWSAGRSPRVREVNPGRDPSVSTSIHGTILLMHVGVSKMSYETRLTKGYSSSLTKKSLWQSMRILSH